MFTCECPASSRPFLDRQLSTQACSCGSHLSNIRYILQSSACNCILQVMRRRWASRASIRRKILSHNRKQGYLPHTPLGRSVEESDSRDRILSRSGCIHPISITWLSNECIGSQIQDYSSTKQKSNSSSLTQDMNHVVALFCDAVVVPGVSHHKAKATAESG